MSNSNFIRSTDFGTTWTTISTSVGTSTPCDIEVFPDTSIILLGDNGTGIFRSTDYGLTWTSVFNTSGEIPTIAVDLSGSGIAWATKWSGGGGFLKSTNFGQSWTSPPLVLVITRFYIADTSTVFAAQGDGLYTNYFHLHSFRLS
ncbi:MAG: hypothetical protein IPH11_16090 [Ignavibacteriales bacterium]|nr:hypothetical protein [Ignavibacteriales bacterium]